MVDPTKMFFRWLNKQEAPVVMEIGTRRSDPQLPVHHGPHIPAKSIHVKVDAFDGIDVDVVADPETLEPFTNEQYDAVICVSALEHIPRPWKAIEQFFRVLKVGGYLYVSSHQSFPLHGQHDYFRFSTDAYRTMGDDAGLTTIATSYEHPTTLTAPRDTPNWDPQAPAYLNSTALYQKNWQK